MYVCSLFLLSHINHTKPNQNRILYHSFPAFSLFSFWLFSSFLFLFVVFFFSGRRRIERRFQTRNFVYGFCAVVACGDTRRYPVLLVATVVVVVSSLALLLLSLTRTSQLFCWLVWLVVLLLFLSLWRVFCSTLEGSTRKREREESSVDVSLTFYHTHQIPHQHERPSHSHLWR